MDKELGTGLCLEEGNVFARNGSERRIMNASVRGGVSCRNLSRARTGK